MSISGADGKADAVADDADDVELLELSDTVEPASATASSTKAIIVKLTPKQVRQQQRADERTRQREERERRLADEKEQRRIELEKKRQEQLDEKRRKEEQKDEERRKRDEQNKEERRKRDEQKEEERRKRDEQKDEERRKKEEERRKRDEQKEDERRKKEEEKLAKEEAERRKHEKNAAVFSKFFVTRREPAKAAAAAETLPPGTASEASNDGSTLGTDAEVAAVPPQRNFMPFCVKEDMKLAPLVRRAFSDRNRRAFDERALLPPAAAAEQRLYLAELREKAVPRGRDGKTWPADEAEVQVVGEFLFLFAEKSIVFY